MLTYRQNTLSGADPVLRGAAVLGCGGDRRHVGTRFSLRSLMLVLLPCSVSPLVTVGHPRGSHSLASLGLNSAGAALAWGMTGWQHGDHVASQIGFNATEQKVKWLFHLK